MSLCSLKDDKGFTLVETLVALFIFALIGSASTALMVTALSANEAVQETAKKTEELHAARAILISDFLHLVPRPTANSELGRRSFGFAGGVNIDRLLADTDKQGGQLLFLSRLGWSNPEGRLPRGRTQQVIYLFQNDQLIRRSFSQTDPAADTIFQDRMIMSDLKKVEFTFFDGHQWHNSWRTGDWTSATLPRAVRLTTEDEKHGLMEQIFLVNGPGFPGNSL